MGFLNWTKIVFVSLLILGCGTSETQLPQADSGQAQESSPAPAVRESMLASTDWLNDNLGAENLVVLHVSTGPGGYDSEHIPGALYLGWDRIARTEDGVANELPPVDSLTALLRGMGIDRDDRVVIYDEENGIRAARAYLTLDFLGLGDNACLLDGQLKLWKNEGRPLSTETPSVQPSDFQPRLNRGVVVGMEEVRRMVALGEQGLLDCRPPENFSGQVPGRDIERGGHIPGARNVPALRSQAGEDNPKFLSTDELRELYSRAGFGADKPVVSYCRTGRSASLGYFVLKYLGYDVRLYDGSFSQWQSQQSNPVETTEGQ